MQVGPTASDLEILKSLEIDIRRVLRNYAKANRIAAGMVHWSDELRELYDKCRHRPQDIDENGRQKYRSWRITPVTNHHPFCQWIRLSAKGECGCLCSDAQHSEAAHQRGAPIVYRCHAGLIDIVCCVYIGTKHVANIYGGQVTLAEDQPQDLRSHPLLKEFVMAVSRVDSAPLAFLTSKTLDARTLQGVLQAGQLPPDCASCLESISPPASIEQYDELKSKIADNERRVLRMIAEKRQLADDDEDFIGPNIPQEKTPDQLYWSILQLRDIAVLLSRAATEKKLDACLKTVEREVSELADVEKGIDAYLRVFQELTPYRIAVLFYQSRDSGVPWHIVVSSGREGLDHGQASALEGLKRHLQSSADGIASGAWRSEADQKAKAFLTALGCSNNRIQSFRLGSADQRFGMCYLGYGNPQNLFQQEQAQLVGDMVVPRISALLEAADEMQLLFETQQDVASMAIHPTQVGLPQAIVKGGARLYGAGIHVGLWLFNHSTQEFRHLDISADDPFDKSVLPYLDGHGQPTCISARAVVERKPYWVTKGTDEWRLHCLADLADKHGFRSVLSVPLIAGTRLVGVLNIHQKTPQAPTAHEKGLLGSYGKSTAHTLQTWDLNRAANALDRCESFRDIEDFLQKEAHRITGARMGSLWFYRDDLEMFVVVGVWGTSAGQQDGKGRDMSHVLMHKRPYPKGTVTEQLLAGVPCYGFSNHEDNCTSFQITTHFKDYNSWIALPLRSLRDDEARSKPLGALFLDYEARRTDRPVPPNELPKWDDTEKHYLASFAAYLSGAVDRISRVLLLRCRNTYMRYDQDIAHAQYESAAALAQIEDLGKHADLFSAANLTSELTRCVKVIRKSLSGKNERDPGPSYVGSLDTIVLGSVVEECWKIVQERSIAENITKSYHEMNLDGKSFTLDWPGWHFRHVLEGLIETVVSLVMETPPSHASPATIEINAYRWHSDVHLTFWSKAIKFDENHIEQINTNQDSPRYSKRIDGLRKADSFLFLAGGRLWAEQADSGFVIKTIIPRKYHLHKGG